MAEQIVPAVDVYWSFRSPFSYLATPDMLKLTSDYNVIVNLRPVLPIAVRRPEFFSPEKANWARYIVLDWNRRAEYLGMVHEWPNPDPIVQDLATFSISNVQPYIFRLTNLGVEAQRQGKGPEFAKEISHLIFGGTKNWDQGDHLANACDVVGLSLSQMDRAIENGDHGAEVDENQSRLEASGHWGVPTFVFENEPFFGQDRVELLRWRLNKHGLKKS